MVLKLWTLRKLDQKYINSFEMWCWRRMENISWIDSVRNDQVLPRIKEDKNIYTHKIEERLTGLVISFVGTAFQNTLLKEG